MAVVHLQMKDEVAIVTLDDGNANAFSFQLIEELMQKLDEVEEAGEAKALILRGSDRLFSGGFDLKVMMGGVLEEVTKLVRRGRDVVFRLLNYFIPVITVCTGSAVAMGAIVLLASDVRIGVRSTKAKIGLNETKIGILLVPFGLELARYRLTQPSLHRAVTFATMYSPDKACQIGYLDSVCDSVEECMKEAMREAIELAKLPREVYAAAKKRVNLPASEAIKAAEMRYNFWDKDGLLAKL